MRALAGTYTRIHAPYTRRTRAHNAIHVHKRHYTRHAHEPGSSSASCCCNGSAGQIETRHVSDTWKCGSLSFILTSSPIHRRIEKKNKTKKNTPLHWYACQYTREHNAHTRTQTHTRTHTSHTRTCTHVHTQTRQYTLIHGHTRAHTHMHAHTSTCMRIHAHTRASTHTHALHAQYTRTPSTGAYTRMHAEIRAHMLNTGANTPLHADTRQNMRIHANTCACTHILAHTRTYTPTIA